MRTRKKVCFLLVALVALVLCVSVGMTMVVGAKGFEVGIKYVTDYSSHADAVAAAAEVDLEKDEEAMVLLKNNGALPLSTTRKVSVFGSDADDFATALTEEGFTVNPTLFGTDSYDPDKIGKAAEQSLDNYNHVGIITLSRLYGETCDAPTALLPKMPEVQAGIYDAEENTTYQGDSTGTTKFQHADLYSVADSDGTVTEYKHSLMMSEAEERMIAYVKEHCDVVIVAWTGATTFEMKLLQDDLGVDGIIWTNEYGSSGAKAFAEILSGKINPSGKTEAVWYSDFTADPTWYNVAWQRQIYGFSGTTLGSFVAGATMAYGYTPEELDAFPADSDYQAAAESADMTASRYVGLKREGEAAGNEYTIWPANAGPVSGLSTMFDYGMGYDYRATIQYDEGIYMGYKYYETAYAEIAAGNYIPDRYTEADGYSDAAERAEAWYEDTVVYPFGYGLSYTHFDWELVDYDVEAWDNMASAANDSLYSMASDDVTEAQITFTVKVTNKGTVAGKDVVEIYSHAPYTSGEVEKSENVLVSFEKTALLSPGQSDILKLTVNIQDMASFDYNNANNNGYATYELDAGSEYEIRFQTDSHNTKAGMTDDGVTDGVFTLTDLANDVIMGYDDFTGNEAEAVLSQDNIYNSLGWDIDITKADHNGDSDSDFITRVDKDSTGRADMTLMTRADFKGTHPKNTYVYAEDLVRSDEYFALRNSLDGYDADYATYAEGTTVSAIWEEWEDGSDFTGGDASHNIIDSVTGDAISGFKGFHVGMWGTGVDGENEELKTFAADGTINGKKISQMTIAEQGENYENVAKFITMFGVDLADTAANGGASKWIDFMNQLSWYDILEVCSNGGSTCAVASIDKVKSNGSDSPRNWNGYNWGSMSAMAATWNKELCYKIGTIYGNLGKLNRGNEGADWWGPGGDIHRTPFCGRYNDYFSSDGYHGGMIAAAVISGAQSRGVACMIKHIALNDQEAFRGGASTYCTEQAARENQFKLFQIALQEGGAKATMGSLACIGDIYANCNYAFAKQILRDEWGWMGYFATDGYGVSAAYWPMDLLVRNGGWPLGSDPKTDNSAQNYLSGSYSEGNGTTLAEGVYTGYVDGTDATGSDIGKTYDYTVDISGEENARLNPTQWYWSRTVAQYVLYAQSTTGTIQNGIDLDTFSAADVTIETSQHSAVSKDISVASYAEDCGDNVKYAVTGGTLPEGIALSEAGVISGTTAESGVFTVEVTCTIDNWMTTTKTVVIDVDSKFVLDDPDGDFTSAKVGVAFGGIGGLYYLDSETDTTVYTYKVASGALPDGLTLNSATGEISGTPTAAGTFTARIAAVTVSQSTGGNQGQGGPNTPPGAGGGGGSSTTETVYGYYDLTIDVAEADPVDALEIRVSDGYVQYRLENGEWQNIISVDELKGAQGETGPQGPQGPQGEPGENAEGGCGSVVALGGVGVVLAAAALAYAVVMLVKRRGANKKD